MSSILDALNKLEEDKAEAQRDADLGGMFDAKIAARELVGGAGGSEPVSVQMTQGRFVLISGFGAILLVCAVIGITWLTVQMLGSSPSAETTSPIAATASIAPPGPASFVSELQASNARPEDPSIAAPDVQAPAPTESVEVPVVRKDPPRPKMALAPEPVVNPIAEAPRTTTLSVTAPLTRPAPPVEDSIPTWENAAEVEPVPTSQASEEETVAAAKTSEPEGPIDSYPFLTKTRQINYGFSKLTLNTTRQSDQRTPFAFAMINRQKYFVGDRVESSTLTLATVGNMEVLFRDIQTGNYYYFRNR